MATVITLTGAAFTIERDSGEKIGTFKTDESGKTLAPNLAKGTYIASETNVPEGCIRNEAQKSS
ncbi:MAG: prealbumin-like fold domain-containing protein [Clostridiales bacterium]|nr:prealbumin-like fold domain-containing protein [Clostridiales bacterium]